MLEMSKQTRNGAENERSESVHVTRVRQTQMGKVCSEGERKPQKLEKHGSRTPDEELPVRQC